MNRVFRGKLKNYIAVFKFELKPTEEPTMKIGIIREGKVPPDSRVPLTPKQCQQLMNTYGVDLCVQPSDGRCYSNAEYRDLNIPLQEDLSDCTVLMGVKEVPIDQLIADKTYFFFSHTIKEQAYNRRLLQTVLKNHIRLIDYEVLTNDLGKRVIAFGFFAGMVGAHNGLFTYGKRTGQFDLPQMKSFHDYQSAKKAYQTINWPNIKIVLTGTGRVGQGSARVLEDMGIRRVEPSDFLTSTFDEAVFTQLRVADYVEPKDDNAFVAKDFYRHPSAFQSTFKPYTQVADIMINGIFWDNQAPPFFTVMDMRQADFNIQVIADVTCDIAPVSSIPSTLRASTISDPVFGFDPLTGKEVPAFSPDCIDMMTIDNLPNELPRDASQAFGDQFLEHVLPQLADPNSEMLKRATIAEKGQLGRDFSYLVEYVAGVMKKGINATDECIKD